MLGKIVGYGGLLIKYPALHADRDNLRAAIMLRNQFINNKTSDENRKKIGALFLERDVEPFKNAANEELIKEILYMKPISSTENVEKIKYLHLIVKQPSEEE